MFVSASHVKPIRDVTLLNVNNSRSETIAINMYAFVVAIYIYDSKCCFNQCKVAVSHFTLLSLTNLINIQIRMTNF